ncbi:hypothetical protein Tco_1175114 [Tanacetum coccineum]
MIMRANGLTFAVVAASPTIGVLSLGVLIIYKLVKRDDHEVYWHGLLLYTLDQLYKAMEMPAKATHEWER